LEAGLKISLPLSPLTYPHFQSRDCGGGISSTGALYGCEALARTGTVYLQGSI